MSKRLLMLSLIIGLSTLSTGCFPRVRQCIANRWHAHQMYGGYGGACCTPAFKVPAQAVGPIGHSPIGCSSCGSEGGGAPIVYQGGHIPPSGPVYVPGGTPTIGAPMPLPGSGAIPGTMPPKN